MYLLHDLGTCCMGSYWRNFCKLFSISLTYYLFHRSFFFSQPLAIRAKGMSLSVASNWLWNFGIGYATPYLVNPSSTGLNGIQTANLGVKVFFIWGGTCVGCFIFTWVLFSLSLCQVRLSSFILIGTSLFLKRKDCHWNRLIFSTSILRVCFMFFDPFIYSFLSLLTKPFL